MSVWKLLAEQFVYPCLYLNHQSSSPWLSHYSDWAISVVLTVRPGITDACVCCLLYMLVIVYKMCVCVIVNMATVEYIQHVTSRKTDIWPYSDLAGLSRVILFTFVLHFLWRFFLPRVTFPTSQLLFLPARITTYNSRVTFLNVLVHYYISESLVQPWSSLYVTPTEEEIDLLRCLEGKPT